MKKLIFSLAPLCLVSTAIAQISFIGGTYTQNFDSLPPTGINNPWANNTTLTGWGARSTNTATISTILASTGSTVSGNLVSLGALNGAERALGTVVSNTFTGAASASSNYIYLQIKNDTGSDLTDFTVNYTGEQWRRVNNTTQHSLKVDYLVNATSVLDAGFNNIAALTFTGPQAASSALVLDGNNAANRVTDINATVTVNIADGDVLWLRFVDFNDAGDDHQLAIDDFSFTATEAVPEPATMTILAGAAALAALRRRKK